MFNPHEEMACRRLVSIALEEDLGAFRDLTSHAFFAAEARGTAALITRQRGVVSGLPAVALVLAAVDPLCGLEMLIPDGTTVDAGTTLGRIHGPLRSLLTAERTALNFLQHLSGIASLARRFVDAVAGLRCQILDTRKTLPGWRLLEKYAVRCGGGHNHRMGLFDAILVKDNHLAAWRDRAHPITDAIAAARALPVQVSVEIEVDTLEQFDEALAARADVILLDNMPPEQMREAVRRRNATAPQVLLEASGGVNLETVRAIAETGVDRISVGAITHSAPALDIGLDYESS
jgi:nicotinate-nucleotide pyrophosphorylase (carboxylating)